jgi:two-component system, OmpR family, response regulator
VARLLVVEDDVDVRSLLHRRLGVGAHEVLAVDSAEEALSLTDARGLPDIAILDVGLPGMNGLDLARELRTRDGGAALHVIFLSANVLPEHIAAGHALGGQYLTKPFEKSALLAAVDDAMNDPTTRLLG